MFKTQGPPIRVMHIVARMNVGGPAILISDLMRNVDSNEFNQVLITGYCDSNEIDYIDEIASDIRPIRINGLGRSLSLLKDLKAFLILLREIRKFRPDIVHTHTFKAGLLGRIASLIAKPSSKRIHTFHGHLLHGYFNGIKVIAFIFIERCLGRFTHDLIAVGTHVKKELLEVGIGSPDKFHVIFPGLIEEIRESKEKCRRDIGLSLDEILILYVGRLTQIKRPDRLIEIMTGLKESEFKVRLLVVGGGELFDQIRKDAEDHQLAMTFFGWRNDVNKFMGASDIAILCSDNEGVPLTLIQSAQASLPIVSTDVGSVSDIVQHNVNGFLTDTDSCELVKSLQKLITNPNLRETFGACSFEIAKNNFSSKSMILGHEKLYRSTIR